MPVTRIDDAQDVRVAELTQLTDAAARRSIEAEHGCFVAEGYLVLEAVVATGHRIRQVLCDERRVDRVVAIVGDDVSVHAAPSSVLEDVAGYAVHRGVLASVDRPAPAPLDDLLAGSGDVVLVEGVNDHENIGSLFRNAAAFGVDAVVLDEACADPLYRRSVRVSLGHVLRVPWTTVPDTAAALRACRTRGTTTVALSPAGSTPVGALRADRVAWLLGAEGPGLSPETLAAADLTAAIPMADGVDSLNVATAFAVACGIRAATG